MSRGYVFCSQLLEPARCKAWIERAGTIDWAKGTTFGGDETYRKTAVHFVPIESNDDTQLILRFGLGAAYMLGIDVRPQGPENLQFAKYLPGDYYKTHSDDQMDHNVLHEIRKISVAVVLSEEPTIIIEGVEMPPMKQGSALAFPSFREHRVDVSEHDRFSLVGWFPGADWR